MDNKEQSFIWRVGDIIRIKKDKLETGHSAGIEEAKHKNISLFTIQTIVYSNRIAFVKEICGGFWYDDIEIVKPKEAYSIKRKKYV